MRIVTIVAVVALSVTPDLHAQPAATSLASLAERIKAGQPVVVTLESGEVIKGELATVSDAGLILKEPTRTLSATDVQRVAQSRRFARRGALIGGSAGVVLGGAMWLSLDDCSETVGPCRNSDADVIAAGAFLGVLGALGAGVGAVIGALVRGERVVYERTQSRPAQTVVRPLVLPGRAGLGMEIQW